MTSHSHSSSTANVVGVHYRVGKKIGEGSFGVIFEGTLYSLFLRSIPVPTALFLCRNELAQFPDRRHQIRASSESVAALDLTVLPYLGTPES